MAISSVVVVAEDMGTDTIGAELAFTPGQRYPVEQVLRLYVQGQPFPRIGSPNRVVPAIVRVQMSYGRYNERRVPPTLEPDEHWLRELAFDATFRPGSWRVNGNQASVDITISAGLRDNTPPGQQSEPDDTYVAHIVVKALCIWTIETRKLSDLFRYILRYVPRFRSHL